MSNYREEIKIGPRRQIIAKNSSASRFAVSSISIRAHVFLFAGFISAVTRTWLRANKLKCHPLTSWPGTSRLLRIISFNNMRTSALAFSGIKIKLKDALLEVQKNLHS